MTGQRRFDGDVGGFNVLDYVQGDADAGLILIMTKISQRLLLDGSSFAG